MQLIFLNFFLKRKKSKADWSVNAGNWNWVSSGDPDEIKKNASNICPVKNAKKIDPNADYIK